MKQLRRGKITRRPSSTPRWGNRTTGRDSGGRKWGVSTVSGRDVGVSELLQFSMHSASAALGAWDSRPSSFYIHLIVADTALSSTRRHTPRRESRVSLAFLFSSFRVCGGR